MTRSSKNQARWRSRIVAHGEADPQMLIPNPQNFRTHPKGQQSALSGALSELGWLQEILVNRTTGHVVDGHLRIELALAHGETAVPVTYVELSEDEERLALATFDPIGTLAETDTRILGEVLRGIDTGNADLQTMLGELAQAEGITTLDWESLASFGEEPALHTVSLQLTSEEKAELEAAMAAAAARGLVPVSKRPNRGQAVIAICRDWQTHAGEV